MNKIKNISKKICFCYTYVTPLTPLFKKTFEELGVVTQELETKISVKEEVALNI